MIDISIIIINYNTKQLVLNCIESIQLLTTGLDYEIIIIDNCSEDISSLKDKGNNIIIKQLNKNIGFGNANNKGAELASGKILFFLNPDTILDNNAIKILFDFIITHKNAGAVGANLYDTDNNPIHSYFFFTLSFKHLLRNIFQSAKKIHSIENQHNFTGKPRKVDFITGADLMIEKKFFNEIGGFNKNIFMYYEDVDICKKLRIRNRYCYSIPEAKIIHLEGKSFVSEPSVSAINDKKTRMNIKSQSVYLKSNLSNNKALLLLRSFILVLSLKKFALKTLGKSTQGVDHMLKHYQLLRQNYNETNIN